MKKKAPSYDWVTIITWSGILLLTFFFAGYFIATFLP